MLASHFPQFIAQYHKGSTHAFKSLVRKLCELTDSGSSCLDLHHEPEYSIEEWQDILRCDQDGSAVSSPGGSTPLILTEHHQLYLQRYYLHEKQVFDAIDRTARTAPYEINERILSDIHQLLGDPSTNDQAQAAVSALRHRLCIISGGPGTGKTTTVVSILEVLRNNGSFSSAEECLLLAPTGKAADRLRQSIQGGIQRLKIEPEGFPTETSTIHRALGYRPESIEFRHHANNPLQARVVVIDESSMVDLPLMARLLDAIPEEARIILLGDKNQLASVQIGTVLSDLMQASQVCDHPIRDCSVTLRTSYRTKGAISLACDAIRHGDSKRCWKIIQESTESPEFEGTIQQQQAPQNLHKALHEFVNRHWLPVLQNSELSKDEKIRQIDQFRILTPTNKGLYGVESINHSIDQILIAHGIPKRDAWYPGRSVIIQKNDYTMGLYNGDIGLTLEDEAAPNPSLNVYFESAEAPLGVQGFSPALLPECNTAWALTIHRTQGSEYDHILLIIPPNKDSKILSRELLYTGLSRAKLSATLWCSEAALTQTIDTTVQRASGLSSMFV